jgi:hypothetical protein
MKKYLFAMVVLFSGFSFHAFAGPEDCGSNWRWDEDAQECVPKPVGSIRG